MPTWDKDRPICHPKKFHGAIEPELVIALALEVSRVGMRDERHGTGTGNKQPNALSGPDVLGNLPSRRGTEGARDIDDLHTVAKK